MTPFQKGILAVVGVVVLIAIYGGYEYPVALPQTVGTSTTGTTFGTAKFAGVAVNLANPGANGTTSSVLNTDANDRYVSSIKIGCEGVGTSLTAYTGAGLASLTMFAATSSSQTPTSNAFNTNKVGGGNVTIGTSTVTFAEGSSTTQGGATAGNNAATYSIWPTGTYMVFTTNATNTALCTFGVDYFNS